MKYEIVTAESFGSLAVAKELTEKVNQKLEEGWKLYGFPSPPMVRGEGIITSKIIMTQAMIKE